MKAILVSLLMSFSCFAVGGLTLSDLNYNCIIANKDKGATLGFNILIESETHAVEVSNNKDEIIGTGIMSADYNPSEENFNVIISDSNSGLQYIVENKKSSFSNLLGLYIDRLELYANDFIDYINNEIEGRKVNSKMFLVDSFGEKRDFGIGNCELLTN